jgi:hypothetical protein
LLGDNQMVLADQRKRAQLGSRRAQAKYISNGHVALERNYQALSLFRIAISIYLLSDFISYGSCCFDAFYGNSGILPSYLLPQMEHPEGPIAYGILCFLDSVGLPYVFQWLYYPALLSLAIGVRTRASNAVVFLLSCYLHTRNPYITSGADNLADLMLLWSLFLPLNRHWSVDAALATEPPKRVEPLLPFVVIKIQVCSMYLFPVLVKLTGEPWRHGYAVVWALSDNTFGGTPIARFLVENAPGLLHFANYAIMAFQLSFPVLVFCPWRNSLMRGIALLLAAFLHISFVFCLRIGGFPFISLCALLVLVSDAWLAAIMRLSVAMPIACTISSARYIIAANRWSPSWLGGGARPAGAAAPLEAPEVSSARRTRRYVLRPHAEPCASVLCGFLALLGLTTNIQSIVALQNTGGTVEGPGYFKRVLELAAALQVAQHWYLFAPVPAHFVRQYRILVRPGQHETGELAPEPQRPALFADDGGSIDFVNHRWAKYFSRVQQLSEAEWKALGAFVCRRSRDDVFAVEGEIRSVGIVASVRTVEYGISAHPEVELSQHWFNCSPDAR